jgi:hypothetical protein
VRVTYIAQKPAVVEQADESDGEVDSSSEEYDSDDPTAALIRETKREVAAERRKSRDTRQGDDSPRGAPNGDASLHGLQSLSGDHGKRDMSNIECFKCGQRGHLQSECPKPRGSAGRGRGRGKGRR